MMPSTMQYGTFLENPPRHLSHLTPGSAIHLYRRNRVFQNLAPICGFIGRRRMGKVASDRERDPGDFQTSRMDQDVRKRTIWLKTCSIIWHKYGTPPL